MKTSRSWPSRRETICSDFEAQIGHVRSAVDRGEISEERIDASVLRILEAKLSLGIIETE